LQKAGQFKGKTLKAEDEFDLRFADLTDKSQTTAELGD
jgi:sulfonate transport system substrate-binding protein